MNIKTHEYPGYPTDLMAPMVTLLTQVPGESRVFETIWDNRLAFVEVLRVMGADITTMDPHRVLIKGPRPLKARAMESPDVRAGLAFIIAAAIAQGTSEISNIHHIDRGYENIAERLHGVGMRIERVNI
jgi:UDP-N-acetylglucosamine 1-carboxyvinyltransferase